MLEGEEKGRERGKEKEKRLDEDSLSILWPPADSVIASEEFIDTPACARLIEADGVAAASEISSATPP